MAINLGTVNTSTDTFGDWVDKTNDILNLLLLDAVTANSTGAITTGNGFVNGHFGANTLVMSNLQGGNVGTPSDIALLSNVIAGETLGLIFGNTTVNASSNSTLIRLRTAAASLNVLATGIVSGIVTVNATALAVGANTIVNATTIFMGNSTINSSMNSSSWTLNPNSTASIVANSTTVAINISSSDAALKVMQRGSGNAFVVEDIAADASPFVIDGAGRVIIGANVTYTTVGFTTSPAFQMHGNTAAMTGQVMWGWGNTLVQYFNFSENSVISDKDTIPALPASARVLYQASGRVHTDANTLVPNFTMRFSVDGTANTTTIPTSLSILLQNATSTTLASRFFLAANGNLGLGTVTPTDALHAVGNVFASVGLKAGSNVSLTTTTLSMGNATSNLLANSITLKIENATHNATMNSSSLATNTGIFSTSVNVGANVSLSTVAALIGNSTINARVNSIALIIQDTTNNVQINSSSIATNVGAFSTSVNTGANVSMNVTHFRVGNSTINASMNSSTVATNTGAFSTSVNVGANVSMNLTHMFIGNSTINALMNSTFLKVASIGVNTGTPDATLHVVGTANVTGNVTITGDLTILGNTITTGTYESTGDIIPISNNYLLGNATRQWLVYSSNLTSNHTATFANVAISGTIDSSVKVGGVSGQTTINSSSVDIGGQIVQSALYSTSNTGTAELLDSWQLNVYRAGDYITTITNLTANGYQMTKFGILSFGGGVHLTEYATLTSNNTLGVFTANANATHARVYFNSGNATMNVGIRSHRVLIDL
jgi:hypothetical protein